MVRALSRYFLRIRRYSDRSWYPVLIGLLAGADLFVLVIPTDALIVASVLLRPRRWLALTLWPALLSALGSAALAFGIHHLEFGDSLSSPRWENIAGYVQDYGAWVVAAVAALPVPTQAPVAICALAGVTPGMVFAATLLGRLVKYGLFAWSLSHAPRLYSRLFGRAKRLRQEAEELAGRTPGGPDQS